MDDPFGSGMDRPDLESILQRGTVSAEELDAICWYAWSLEGRIHRLELALDGKPPRGFKPFEEISREIRARPGAEERIAEIRAEIERLVDEFDGE